MNGQQALEGHCWFVTWFWFFVVCKRDGCVQTMKWKQVGDRS